jgi:hypothetical protein
LDNHDKVSRISIGFVQDHTQASSGDFIETQNRKHGTLRKLRLFTLEIALQPNAASLFPKYLVLGHADKDERDRWLIAIRVIIERKQELKNGWAFYVQHNLVSDWEKAEQWMKLRDGDAVVAMNLRARRLARLRNGKVLQDVPRVFERHSEELHWTQPGEDGELPVEQSARYMDASRVIVALAELGLELMPELKGRLLEDLERRPLVPDMPGKLALGHFRAVFESCREEMTVSPSAELRNSLLRIMRESRNPFLGLLSPAEQAFLVDGRNELGHLVCTCRSHSQDAVLVRQDEPGDSLFVVLDGSLSVVMAFGAGAGATQREVAELRAGAVMGEMSLVLGKPRNATCVVKSDSASVAEVSRAALDGLLAARPSLARELQDIVNRRDAANACATGRGRAEALRLAAASVPPTAPSSHRHRLAGAAGGGLLPLLRAASADADADAAGRGAAAPRRQAKRILSRAGLVPRQAAGPPAGDDPAGAESRGAAVGSGRVKSGRWVQLRGVYVFVVD